MPLLARENQFPLESRTAIVTGGSQGLGLAIAKLLSARGANVVIVAQDIPKLEKAAREVAASAKSPSTQRFHYLSFDLRDPTSAPQILSTVTTWNNGAPPTIVFSCAGYCIPGFFAATALQTLREQMDTLYWSAAYLAHATLNLWTQSTPPSKPKGQPSETHHLILTSSVLAFLPLAGYAPYSPAKAAIKSLADTLTQELAVYNASPAGAASPIRLATLYPVGILSPGYQNEQTLKPQLTQWLEKDDKPQTPDEVARVCIQQLEKGAGVITTGLLGALLKGMGGGASPRDGVADSLFYMVGSVIAIFVGKDFVSKCQKWGREKGSWSEAVK